MTVNGYQIARSIIVQADVSKYCLFTGYPGKIHLYTKQTTKYKYKFIEIQTDVQIQNIFCLPITQVEFTCTPSKLQKKCKFKEIQTDI